MASASPPASVDESLDPPPAPGGTALDRVHDELEAEIDAVWAEVRREVEARAISWREAAYVVALSRVAEAHRLRGLWP